MRLLMTLRLGVLTLVVLLLGPSSLAAPGDVYTTYGGGDGIVVPVAGNVKVDVAAGLPNGHKLVGLLGGPSGIKLKRFDQAGNEVWESISVPLEGYVGYLSVGYDAENDLTYLAGTPDEQFTTRIWRFTSTGFLDTTTNWAPTGYELYGDGTTESIAVQPNGKLVMVGNAGGAGGRPYVRRLTTTGSLDTLFDGDGYWFGVQGAAAGFQSVHLLPGGKILAVGTTQFRMKTARFLGDGTPDDSWGGDGWASYETVMPGESTQTTVWAPALAVQPDGRVVFMAGLNAHDLDPGSGFEVPAVLGRWRANGTPDPTFPQRIIRASSIAPATSPSSAAARSRSCSSWPDLSLRRLYSNGTDDTTLTNWTSADVISFAQSVQVQPNGRIGGEVRWRLRHALRHPGGRRDPGYVGSRRGAGVRRGRPHQHRERR